MTVATNSNRADFNGNGSTTVFPFTFRIFAATDLVVVQADADGVETVLDLGDDYTVSGVGSYNGGNVTVTTAVPSGEKLTIVREVPITQATDLRNQGAFFAETHEDVFDRLVMIGQQLQEQIDRCAKLPVTNTADAEELITDIVTLADELAKLTAIYNQLDDIDTVATDLDGDDNIGTVAANIGSVNAVAAIDSDVSAVAAIDSNVTTVAGINANVTTVAGIAPNVTTVAGISSAVSTVATNNSNVTTVAGINAAVSTVAGISSAVSTVSGISAAVSTVAADGTDIGVVAGISTEVQICADRADDIETLATQPLAADISFVANIDEDVSAVAAIASDVTAVAAVASDVSAIAAIDANVTGVANISADVTAVANIAADVTTVATNAASVNTVAGDIAAIITAANDLNEAVSEIEVVANNIAAVDTVGTAIADVSAVAAIAADVSIAADNVADITNFADVYQGASSTAPTTRNDSSALQVGDLYFNTTDDQMKVYGGSGWQSVGSTVNGTSQRYRYIATAAQTTFTGSDSNTNTLAYDVGFIDVYLNGVRLDQTDYTASSGDSVVLASGAAADDEVNIVTYGNFELADHYNKTDSDSRYVNVAGDTMTGTLNIEGTGQLRGASDAADSLTLIGGADDTNNRIQIRGTNHPSTPNVATLDLDGGEVLRYTSTTKTEFGYPSYQCRAWVNFNGTGTVAIRASGNVSSITDNGSGDYTVNFTTAMPDANYCGVARGDRSNNATSDMNNSQLLHTYATGSVRLKTGYPQGINTTDDSLVSTVAIFR